MSRLGITVLAGVCAVVILQSPADAFQTVRYPRVYGPTGRPYGPTQAHYQYQKQYGRPWHGYGGITAPSQATVNHFVINGYNPFATGFIGGYGGCYHGPSPFAGFGYTPPVAPPLYLQPPPVVAPNPFAAVPRRNNFVPLGVPAPAGQQLVVGSSPEAKLKSVRAQAQGDAWFKQQEYHKAFDRYKAAVEEAGDRGEAHLRLAICYAALGHLDLAARQLKRGTLADPQMAASADDLESIYGAGNSIAQSSMVHQATLWAKEDIRDPDRLFLLGVLLYLKGNENAPLLLETGMALRGGGDHFRSFLTAATTSVGVNTKTAKPPVQPKVIKPGQDESDDSSIVPPLPAPLNNNDSTPPDSAPPGPALIVPSP